jgi:cytohesin
MLQIIMGHAFVEPARKIDLIEAAQNGRMSELRAKLHLTNVDINSEDSDGRTGVHWAAAKGKTEALQLLLQHGGDPNRADKYGQTPVSIAAVKENTQALQLLLQHGGDPNRAAKNSRTPVHKAASNGKTEALQLLLQHGGDPNRAAKDADGEGETAQAV